MVNNLWAVYVVATFAASGFSFSDFGSTEIYAKIFLSIGFWAFALGHLGLLWQTLRVLSSTRDAITMHLGSATSTCEPNFRDPLLELVRASNPFWVSALAHITINCCVTLIIWAN